MKRLILVLLFALGATILLVGCAPQSVTPTSATSSATTVPLEADEPLPYVEEEVVIQNGDIHLAGTLTLPSGAGPHPAVILISGSGPSNRDEAIDFVAGYRPFRVIADHLTRQGVAVLRYDDRGVDKSTGDHASAASADLATDAETVFRYLQSRKEINPKQIGLLGHSEGSMIAAMIAARNAEVAFVISMGGTAASGYDVIVLQQERALAAMGADESTKTQQVRITRAELDLIRAEDWQAYDQFKRETLALKLQALPEEKRKELGDLNAFTEKVIAQQMINVKGWLHYFITHDWAADWAKAQAPVLAIQGELDTQVDAAQAQASLEQALQRADNKDVTIVVLPKANHLFQQALTGAPDEYAKLPPDFVPGFLPTISNWLLKRVTVASGK